MGAWDGQQQINSCDNSFLTFVSIESLLQPIMTEFGGFFNVASLFMYW